MTANTETNQSDTVEVNELGKVLAIIDGWHSNKVATLEHMLHIPAGAVMAVAGVETTMEGDFLDGFKAGISLSLMELGTLPFAETPGTSELEVTADITDVVPK